MARSPDLRTSRFRGRWSTRTQDIGDRTELYSRSSGHAKYGGRGLAFETEEKHNLPNQIVPRSPSKLDGEPQPHSLRNRNQRRPARISARRQRAVEAFALDPGSLRHLGHAAPGLRNAAKREQQHTRFFRVFERGLQILRRELRPLA